MHVMNEVAGEVAFVSDCIEAHGALAEEKLGELPVTVRVSIGGDDDGLEPDLEIDFRVCGGTRSEQVAALRQLMLEFEQISRKFLAEKHGVTLPEVA